MQAKSETERVFVRNLPGGGYAAIDVTAERSMLRRAIYRGVLVVERRAIGRGGGSPPVIASATGATVEDVVHQLMPTAMSNVAIGAAMLRHELVAF